jgi:hypothetical protein
LTKPWQDIATNADPQTHPLLGAPAMPDLPAQLSDPAFSWAGDAFAEPLAGLVTAGNA